MCNSRDGARLGSPPRGRGKAAPRQRAHLARWITPAWAGKSQLKQTGLTMQEDHPRVGGEKMCCTAMEFRSSGSPPRGRGKACSICSYRAAGQDHPPRGRGKEAVAPFPLPAAGITPAWAGKRTSPHLYCELSKDHPRVGGEKQNTEQNLTKVRGSPPRGRGKVGPCGVGGTQKRITPAWAGKSHPRTAPRHRLQDHPRVGGEKLSAAHVAMQAKGSPPRGRGKVPTRLRTL